MPEDTTNLTPAEEARFQQWVKANGIRDVDHPDSHYDYRGYWQETGGAPHPRTKLARSHGTMTPEEMAQVGERTHYPDTYKQHGHPTFSVESKYSRGLQDGGRWLPGDTEKAYVKPPLPSHAQEQEPRMPTTEERKRRDKVLADRRKANRPTWGEADAVNTGRMGRVLESDPKPNIRMGTASIPKSASKPKENYYPEYEDEADNKWSKGATEPSPDPRQSSPTKPPFSGPLEKTPPPPDNGDVEQDETVPRRPTLRARAQVQPERRSVVRAATAIAPRRPGAQTLRARSTVEDQLTREKDARSDAYDDLGIVRASVAKRRPYKDSDIKPIPNARARTEAEAMADVKPIPNARPRTDDELWAEMTPLRRAER